MIGRHMTVVVMVMARLVGSAQGSRMGFKEGGWAVVRFRLMHTKHIYRLGTRSCRLQSSHLFLAEE
uniref:Secreted protein n=1 Tax=Triticum urartu TaxID=4572 RepID=A0A8R7QC96_TRIUA